MRRDVSKKQPKPSVSPPGWAEGLLKAADAALFRAKAMGRSQLSVWRVRDEHRCGDSVIDVSDAQLRGVWGRVALLVAYLLGALLW